MTHSLESLGVQELNAQEKREVEGGSLFGFFIIFGIGYLIGNWIRS